LLLLVVGRCQIEGGEEFGQLGGACCMTARRSGTQSSSASISSVVGAAADQTGNATHDPDDLDQEGVIIFWKSNMARYSTHLPRSLGHLAA
jgi:anaerobic selenocysteine-containing dehydrogenase